MESTFINLILLPLAIFFIRIIDVSLGTIRLIFISRGIRAVSAVLGFIEVLVWLLAVSQIMQNLNSPIHYIAYAAGFGMGNFVGVSIEKKLSYGNRIITVITKKDATPLLKNLNLNTRQKDSFGRRHYVFVSHFVNCLALSANTIR